MKANHLPITSIKRGDSTIADRVYCPRLKRLILTEFCKRCDHLHFTVEDEYVKCIFGV